MSDTSTKIRWHPLEVPEWRWSVVIHKDEKTILRYGSTADKAWNNARWAWGNEEDFPETYPWVFDDWKGYLLFRFQQIKGKFKK